MSSTTNADGRAKEETLLERSGNACLVGFTLRLLPHLVRNINPHGLLVVNAGESIISNARWIAEQLAPLGVKVDTDAWAFQHAGRSERKRLLRANPTLHGKYVFKLTNSPIVLGPRPPTP